MFLTKDQAKAMLMKNMNMSEEDFSEGEEWVKNECTCANCPSYTSSETELGFCWPSVGQSEHIHDEKNCICGQCPVFNEVSLQFAYYCTRDSEVQQSWQMTQETAADGGRPARRIRS